MLCRWPVWCAFLCAMASPALARAEGSLRVPDYAPPPRLTRGFEAARATVILIDARSPKPTSRTRANERRIAESADALRKDELANTLQGVLTKAIRSGDAKLVFRVKLVEANELSSTPPVVRAIVDVSVEREIQKSDEPTGSGRTLVSTRGTSTLHGYVGGMSPRTEERIRGAVVDAFERSVLRDEFIGVANRALAETTPNGASATRSVEPVTHEWKIDYDEATAAAHVVSLALDLGKTDSFGTRYLHDHIDSGLGLAWGGYGIEARFISHDFDRLDAIAGLAIVRAGVGAEQGFSIEAGLGPGGRSDMRAIGVAGVYFSFYYVDLGFTFQYFIHPTDELRPLTGPHFGIRVNVPVHIHSVHVRCRSPLPCNREILPGIRR